MTLSNRERQAGYRARRSTAGALGDKRLNTWVGAETMYALQRLARHRGLSQRALVEALIHAADAEIMGRLQPYSAEWTAYTAGPADAIEDKSDRDPQTVD